MSDFATSHGAGASFHLASENINDVEPAAISHGLDAQRHGNDLDLERPASSSSAIRPSADTSSSTEPSGPSKCLWTVDEYDNAQSRPSSLHTVRFASKELLCPWFPEADPEHKRSQTWSVRLARRKTTLIIACVTAWVVFIINLIATVYLPAQNRNAVLYTGRCSTASRIDSALHILINFLASMLLGASNLCMQLLSAPTREEVKRAHSRKKWLDIGIPSTRNLPHIAKRRISAWIILAAASLPLHFLANSAIIGVKPESEFYYSVVTPGFLDGDRVDIAATNATLFSRADLTVVGLGYSSLEPYEHYLGMPYNPYTMWSAWPYGRKTLQGYTEYLLTLQDRIVKLQSNDRLETLGYKNISRLECASREVRWFDTGASNILLISSSDMFNVGGNVSDGNSSLLAFNWIGSSWDSVAGLGMSWPCQNSNNFSCLFPETWAGDAEKVANWNVYGYKVDYCLSKELDLTEKCHVEFNRDIMIVICIANLCKCVTICYTLWIYRDKSITPLASLGDAAVSFLRDPDETTEHMCLASRKNIDSLWTNPVPLPWLPYQYRWWAIASRKLWFGLISAFLATLTVAHVLLVRAVGSVQGMGLSHLGFGQPNAYESMYDIRPRTTIIAGTMFANCWQVIVSLIYVQYNAMLTAFLVGDEWSRFACRELSPEDRLMVKNLQRKKEATTKRASLRSLPRILAKPMKFIMRSTTGLRSLCRKLIVASGTYFSTHPTSPWKHVAKLRNKMGKVSWRTSEPRVRKTLRVSAPIGIQRSSYFVSMPWRYGIPLIATMSLLHWLISQSVFVFAVDIYNGRGHLDFRRFGCGYSVQPIICAISLGWGLLLVLMLLGSRRFPPDMPLASTCSAAISAACHPPREDKEAHLFPIQWGLVSSHDGVGHCSLSTDRDVSAPVVGHTYA